MFQRRLQSRLWYHHPLFIFILFLLLVVIVRATVISFNKRAAAQEEYEQYYQELVELQAKKEHLEYDISKLESERGREEEYRERFNVLKEGEKVIRVVEDEEN